MPLYLDLDIHEWVLEDYTNVDALAITGTVYSDKKLTTAFDLTGYTLSFRMVDDDELIYDDETDAEIVTAASGTWKYLPDSGRLTSIGNGQVSLRIEKSGTQITAIGVNGSADLLISYA